MSDNEKLIRNWIAEVVAERDACTDPDRREVLTLREHKLGGLLPPANGTMAFLLNPSSLD
jgi:hypothetical protein